MPQGLGCGWVELEVLETTRDYCEFDAVVEGRCIQTHYQGEGCIVAECGGNTGTYYRELSHGTYEVFSNTGLCEHQPDGYTLCMDGDEHEACQCACTRTDPVLPPNFADLLLTQGGCGDVSLYGVDRTGRFALYVYMDHGLVAQANETQTVIEHSIIHRDFTTVEVVTGTDLQDVFCTDAPTGTTDQRFVAHDGILDIRIEPGQDGLASATATLRDALFVNEADQSTVSIDSYTFQSISVGWLPG